MSCNEAARGAVRRSQCIGMHTVSRCMTTRQRRLMLSMPIGLAWIYDLPASLDGRRLRTRVLTIAFL